MLWIDYLIPKIPVWKKNTKSSTLDSEKRKEVLTIIVNWLEFSRRHILIVLGYVRIEKCGKGMTWIYKTGFARFEYIYMFAFYTLYFLLWAFLCSIYCLYLYSCRFKASPISCCSYALLGLPGIILILYRTWYIIKNA